MRIGTSEGSTATFDPSTPVGLGSLGPRGWAGNGTGRKVGVGGRTRIGSEGAQIGGWVQKWLNGCKSGWRVARGLSCVSLLLMQIALPAKRLLGSVCAEGGGELFLPSFLARYARKPATCSVRILKDCFVTGGYVRILGIRVLCEN